ncbi:25231_t:CDS:2, partial [Cetraspora pellucida]
VILSVVLPTGQDLAKISPFSNVEIGQYNQNNNVVNDLVKIVTDNSFDGIDIDYPNMLPCYPSQGTQGQNFSTNNLNPVFISLIADLSSKLKQSNNSDKSTNAGINDIQKIFDAWNSYVSKSKLVLGIDFGGIVEVVISSNITADTNNQNLKIVNVTTAQFSFADERFKIHADFQYMHLGREPNTPTSNYTPLSNVGAIVSGVIGSFIFVNVIMAAGFILYRRKYSAGIPDLLVDTNNQACSDTNRHVYSDINCQVRSDTYSRIYSDTNHKVS